MVLVKREKSTDPPTFYMMENKVWNKLYQEFVADPKADGKRQLALEQHWVRPARSRPIRRRTVIAE